MNVFWLLVLVAVAAALAWRSRARTPGPMPSERYVGREPAPGDASRIPPPPNRSSETPLARAVRLAVDGPAGPGVAPSGDDLPFTLDEMQWLMRVVARRVDAHDSTLGLRALAVGGARKRTTKSGAAWYEADVDVHAVGRNVSAKLAVRASLTPGGTLRIHGLKIHGGLDPRAAPGQLAPFEEPPAFAHFVPAATFGSRA